MTSRASARPCGGIVGRGQYPTEHRLPWPGCRARGPGVRGGRRAARLPRPPGRARGEDRGRGGNEVCRPVRATETPSAPLVSWVSIV